MLLLTCFFKAEWFLKVFPKDYVKFYKEIYQVLFNHLLLGTKLYIFSYITNSPFDGWEFITIILFSHFWLP